jgi:hypothetical protein
MAAVLEEDKNKQRERLWPFSFTFLGPNPAEKAPGEGNPRPAAAGGTKERFFLLFFREICHAKEICVTNHRFFAILVTR